MNAIVAARRCSGGTVKLINDQAITPDARHSRIVELLPPASRLPPGFCARLLAEAGGMGRAGREVDHRGHTVARRLAHGLTPIRPRVSQSGVHARADEGDLRDLLRREVPGPERTAEDPLRVSPAYQRLRELDAVFGEKSGWERANWFESNAPSGDEALRPRGWAGKLWSARCRGRAPRVPRGRRSSTSSFAKILVSGHDAAALLERLCANRVARDVGQVTYAVLNPRGGIECDFTVTRLAEKQLPNRDRNRIWPARSRVDHPAPPRRRLGAGHGRNLGSRLFRHLGPEARAILEPLTTADLE